MRRLVRQAVLAVEILRAYIRVRWALWRTDTIVEAVARLRPSIERPLGHEKSVRLGRWLVRPISRTLDALPGDSRCLMRSLVLLTMLRDRNIEATLVIGASTERGFSAHAWVLHEEVQLLPADGHAPLISI